MTSPQRIVRTALLTILVATLFVSVRTTAAQAAGPAPSDDVAVPGIAPPVAAENEIYLDENGQEIPMNNPVPDDKSAAGMVELAAACTPVSGRDNPHYSSGDASGHGWWKKGTCTAGTANVKNCLYEYYTDATWRLKACSPTKTLLPYTGSGQRTVARSTCDNITSTSWRNHVEVDVIGQGDTSERPYNQSLVQCRVY